MVRAKQSTMINKRGAFAGKNGYIKRRDSFQRSRDIMQAVYSLSSPGIGGLTK
jgi:hypothetical protein